jgi:hypothetical protein
MPPQARASSDSQLQHWQAVTIESPNPLSVLAVLREREPSVLVPENAAETSAILDSLSGWERHGPATGA